MIPLPKHITLMFYLLRTLVLMCFISEYVTLYLCVNRHSINEAFLPLLEEYSHFKSGH